MSGYPLRYQGRLIPEIADHFRAAQLLPHLQARGLILNLDHRALVDLGRALREADQDLDLDLFLAEVAAMGQGMGLEQEQGMARVGGPDLLAPEHPDPRSGDGKRPGQGPGDGPGGGPAPDISTPILGKVLDPSGGPAMGLGGTDPASGAGMETPVPFDEIKWFLEDVPDEDDGEWIAHDQ